MTDHDHDLRARTAWREESGEGWRIARRYRVRVCAECGEEVSARPTDLRRRQRESLRDEPPESLLDFLPAKQRRAVPDMLAAMGGNRIEIEHTIGEWLAAGWVEVEEAYDEVRRSWRIERVGLSDAARAALIEAPRTEVERADDRARSEMLALLEGWRADWEAVRGDDHEGALSRLGEILSAQEAALEAGEWLALPGTTQRPGGDPHRRWLAVLRGLVALMASEGWEYERAFSARWLGDSKALSGERRALEGYLGVRLEALGLFRHTPVVYAWGPFAATCGGFAIDGRAGEPFVALAAGSIRALRDVRVDAKAIMVVENQTAFEALLHPPLRRDDWLYLFGGGHAGRAERALIAAWLDVAQNLPWRVWTDWDAGGVRIQADWARWASERGLPAPRPFMWDEASLERWKPLGQPLTESGRESLRALDHPLAARLLSAGYTLEQEAVLAALSPDDFTGESPS